MYTARYCNVTLTIKILWLCWLSKTRREKRSTKFFCRWIPRGFFFYFFFNVFSFFIFFFGDLFSYLFFFCWVLSKKKRKEVRSSFFYSVEVFFQHFCLFFRFFLFFIFVLIYFFFLFFFVGYRIRRREKKYDLLFSSLLDFWGIFLWVFFIFYFMLFYFFIYFFLSAIKHEKEKRSMKFFSLKFLGTFLSFFSFKFFIFHSFPFFLFIFLNVEAKRIARFPFSTVDSYKYWRCVFLNSKKEKESQRERERDQLVENHERDRGN